MSAVITPDGATVYVLSQINTGTRSTAVVTPVATATDTAGAPIPLPDDSDQLVLTADGATVYDNDLTRIDLATGAVSGPGPAAGDAIAIAQVPQQERQSRTSLHCVPTTPVIGESIRCTATVTDVDTGTPVTPSGSVSFTGYVVSYPFHTAVAPVFTDGSCTLSGSGARASCAVTVYPEATDQQITAIHPSDGVHLLSADQVEIQAQPIPTTTALSCAPASLEIGQTARCIVTVTDVIAGGRPLTPTGRVALQSTTPQDGRIHGTGCVLVGLQESCCRLSGTGRVARCSFMYTPYAVGDGQQVLTASFDDPVHAESSGQAVVTVSLRATTTTLRCDPATVSAGQSTTCTATVTDAGPGTQSTPNGGVNFTSGPGGRFAKGFCKLAGSGGVATCQATYTATGASPDAVELTATYRGDRRHQGSQDQTTITVTAPGS